MSSVRPEHKKDYTDFQNNPSNFGNSWKEAKTRETSTLSKFK